MTAPTTTTPPLTTTTPPLTATPTAPPSATPASPTAPACHRVVTVGVFCVGVSGMPRLTLQLTSFRQHSARTRHVCRVILHLPPRTHAAAARCRQRHTSGNRTLAS